VITREKNQELDIDNRCPASISKVVKKIFFNSTKKGINRATRFRWAKKKISAGELDGVYPKDRSDRGQRRRLNEETDPITGIVR
jgi:hypothetical protein